MSRPIIACIMLVSIATGSVIRPDDDITKDVPIAYDKVNGVSEVVVQEVVVPNDFVEPDAKATEGPVLAVTTPTPVDATAAPKQCAGVGNFCMVHSDCCSNACLGYMKRCVSG